jgi:hypothetical protein
VKKKVSVSSSACCGPGFFSLNSRTVLVARVEYGRDAGQQALRVWIALLDCSGEEEGSVQIDVVNAEFFDEESLVLVYRSQDQGTFRLICSAKCC